MEPWVQALSSGSVDREWLIAAVVLGALGVALLLASLAALLRLRPFRFLLRFAAGMVALFLGALALFVTVGTAGYRALTHEETAATVRVQPLAPQRFKAEIRLPDGQVISHELAGDELYIDAHILKWRPIANLAGLHTAYELDRIAGRYHALADEQSAPRTVYALGSPKPIDFFNLRRRYIVLAPLVDAEYGSASFVPVTRPTEFDVRVSTSGLLIRERTQ